MNIYAVKLNLNMHLQKYINPFSLLYNDEYNIYSNLHAYSSQSKLISKLLIKYIVCKTLGIKYEDINIRKTKYGKPYLVNVSNFYYNISHSGYWVLCAVSDYPVGIDIQEIKDIDFDIARRFFYYKEYNDILAKRKSDRLGYFYELWTLKECYIKAVGKGLSLGLNSCYFKVLDNKIFFKNFINDNNYYFYQYNIDNNYKMSICSSEFSLQNCAIKIYTIDEFLKKYYSIN